jgi:hypothetical protein
MKTLAGGTFVSLLFAAALSGCASVAVDSSPIAKSPCTNVDWYEAGRSDGVLGYSLAKLEHYQSLCNGSSSPVKSELYTNGRDAGLIDFCSPTGGLEAGRGSVPYEKVCPENLEPAFLSNYGLGLRIHALESESEDLEARIDNLVGLVSPSMNGGSVRAQIDQLKARQSKINSEISSLESHAVAL